MPSVIELHDSIVTGCEELDGSVVLLLSPAWLHRAPANPGFAAGDVFTLDVDVILRLGAFRRPFTELPTERQGGSISVAGDRFDNCIPSPLDGIGVVIFHSLTTTTAPSS